MKTKNTNNNSLNLKSIYISREALNSGIALVAVLAILVVLAIIASTFTVLMNTENMQSNEQRRTFLLDMLTESGFEHAKSLLWENSVSTKKQNLVKSAAMKFQKQSNSETQNLDSNKLFSNWFYVENNVGVCVGRYRFRIEDEAAKVNINRARLLKDSKGSAWDTSEINLPIALGISQNAAKRLVNYRFGLNNLPGGRGDDDFNNVVLMADGIDNDADGIIDEENEGINDPKEYQASRLKGDDRKFTTVNEAICLLMNKKKIRTQMKNIIQQRATVDSVDMPGSPTLRIDMPNDINSVTARECSRIITKANIKKPFISKGEKKAQIAVNIVDYRDENHVLSTLGSTYGVEAVCFNEIMANDESVTHDLNHAKGAYYPNNKEIKEKRWKKSFGMVDGERGIFCPNLLYDCMPDSPSQIQKNLQILDPREAWHIKKERNSPPNSNYGYIKKMNGKTTTIKWPNALGKRCNKIDVTLYMSGKSQNPPVDILPGKNGNIPYLSWPKHKPNPPLFWSVTDYKTTVNKMLDVLKNVNMKNNYKPKFKKDYFKNSLVNIYKWQLSSKESDNVSLGCFKIISSDENTITFENKNYFDKRNKYHFTNVLAKINMSNKDHDLSITINSWTARNTAWVPEANQTFVVRARQPVAGKYFKILITRPPYSPYNGTTGLFGYPDQLGVSGKIGGGFSEDKNFQRKFWEYNNGKPVITKKNGWINILITSAKDGINRKHKKGQKLNYVRMIAPEVCEMYNASATPVSLANWRVICNTGSKATEIGVIHNTSYYDNKIGKSITTDNPVINPAGHFYLVNDTELFDYWYGNEDSKWGSSTKEEIPVFQMDTNNWGVTYKIKNVRLGTKGAFISLANFNYDAREVFASETIKFLDPKHADDPESWNNVMIYVSDEAEMKPKKNEFFVYVYGDVSRLKGTELMILGLPSSGGILSLTLKNEYNQICARTVDYGKVEEYEIGKSSEKIDPTKNFWVKREVNSIAGQNKFALNQAMRSRHNEVFFIKNGSYVSVGELKNVTAGKNFERLGGQQGDISKGLQSIGALADVMSCSRIRLEAASGNVLRKGWKEAKDEVASSSLTVVKGKNGGWQPDKWKGHTLRFLTGPMRGEKFPVIGNTVNSIILSEKGALFKPYSSPNRKLCRPNKGDVFSVGPSYASAFCYTRKNGDAGEWEWKKILPPKSMFIQHNGIYLYICGLNDAIDTTEFLEENNNASIDVDVWNYKNKEFEQLCKRKKYGKQDSFLAGKISLDNISDTGNFKIRLVAHELINKASETMADTGNKQTGIAWFNYAILCPVPVPARVNINTAPVRLLESIPGITPKIAKNIVAGVDSSSKNRLKPYNRLGDIMKVKNMTPYIFEKCANMLTVDSSYYTIEVEAQLLKGKKNDEYKIKKRTTNVICTRKKRYVMKIERTIDDFVAFKLLEKN